jgi:3-keto-5-aminohexanoate cleavage enzyme
VAHIHARDEQGLPTADPKVYAAIVEEIRSRCDVVVQASTGVGLDVTPEERLEIVGSGEGDVTMATLNPASMTFGAGTFHNPPWFVERLAELMLERGIRPELEVYDFGHVGLCLDLVKRGLVKEPLQFSFVMGVRGGMPGDPALLPQLQATLPAGAMWQAIGIGRAQLPLSFAALAMGGNVRVGFEDNVYFRKGELAESNAQFVLRAVELVHAAGREVASPDWVRERLGVR